MPFPPQSRARSFFFVAVAAGLLALLFDTSAMAGSSPPRGPSESGSHVIFRNGTPSSVAQTLRLIEQEKYQRAARRAHRALRERLSDRHRELMLHAGCVARIELADDEGAVKYCNAAIRMGGPRQWLHLANRGNAHLRAGRTDLAIADFEAASEQIVERGVEGQAMARVQHQLDEARGVTPLAAR